MPEIIGANLKPIIGSDGKKQLPKHTLLSADPVLFDAICVLGGDNVDDESKMRTNIFIEEAYIHFKPIAISKPMTVLMKPKMKTQPGVTVIHEKDPYADKFIADISVHRHWDREINITY